MSPSREGDGMLGICASRSPTDQEEGDETDFPIDEGRYHEELWSWMQSYALSICPCGSTGTPRGCAEEPLVNGVHVHDAVEVEPALDSRNSAEIVHNGEKQLQDKRRQEPHAIEGDWPVNTGEAEAEVEIPANECDRTNTSVPMVKAAIKTNWGDQNVSATRVATSKRFPNEVMEQQQQREQQEEAQREAAAILQKEVDREAMAMHLEDAAAWYRREVQRSVVIKDSSLVASRDRDAMGGMGRVILQATLSCRDDSGIDTALEHRVLHLHVRQREVDAAQHFLEELNGLTPRMVQTFAEPLARWLRRHVELAPCEMARAAYQVSGDLFEIAGQESLAAGIHKVGRTP